MRLLILLALLALARPALALESAPVTSPRATATLVSEADTVQPGTPLRVALRLRMTPGWHTYWKNPGDAGVAPDLSIDATATSPIDWPTPHREPEGPLMTYAYTGDLLLPVTVTPTPGVLRAQAHWLICKDICVPEEASFTLDLPAGPPADLPAGPPARSAQAALFAQHDRATPRPSPWTAFLAPDGTLSVQGPELTPATVTQAWFIPDQPDRIQDSADQRLTTADGSLTLAIKLAPGFDARTGLSGLLSVRDRSGTQTDVTVDAAPAQPVPPSATRALPLPQTPLLQTPLSQTPLSQTLLSVPPLPVPPPLTQILAFAFLGGLILNLMPCVFPILAMKAVGLAEPNRRGHALAYTAGVLVTFAALAGALLVARAAGTAAGWGFQFASPIFVAAMTWLLFAVGLNLSGVFRIGGRMAGMGSGLAQRHGAAGSFFTGLLAVLVATPCTAPFMGGAIAAGLAAPASTTLLVFLVMGLGLAAPYAALAAIPGVARALPRPGRWMDLLKQALAFPMYGAAAWLLWVVSQEAGPAGVGETAVGLVLVGFAGWALGVAQTAAQISPRTRRAGQLAACVAILAAAAILPGIVAAPATDNAAGSDAYTPDRLASLRAQGRPVFVNITAAWCVTCLVNERLAIRTDAVQQAFAARHVTYLKGDWTHQDPAITRFLRQNGREGVPLYVYFPAGNGPPDILPQILTEAVVLRALG